MLRYPHRGPVSAVMDAIIRAAALIGMVMVGAAVVQGVTLALHRAVEPVVASSGGL